MVRNHRTKVEFEPLLSSSDTCIPCATNIPDPRDGTLAFKQSVEALAERYLSGHKLHIQTASLRGPFDGTWMNPWLKNGSSADVMSPANADIPNDAKVRSRKSTRGGEQRKGAVGQRVWERQEYEPVDRDETSTTTSGSKQHAPLTSLTAPDHVVVLSHERLDLVDPRRNQLARGISEDLHRGSGTQTPGKTERHVGNEAIGILSSSLPTPSDSGKSEQADDEAGFAFKAVPGVRETRSLEATSEPDSQVHVASFTAVNRPDQSKYLSTKDANNTKDERVTAQQAAGKRCSQCGTTASHQWRKGPQGPRTLCTSCGAKWTHQQKRDSKGKDETLPGEHRRKYANYQVRRESIKRASKVDASRSRDRVKGHEQIFEKIFPGSLENMELELNPKAVGLRQRPHSSVEEWSQSFSQKSTRNPLSSHARLASPRKEKRSSTLPVDQHDMSVAQTRLRSHRTGKSVEKQRRQVDFDTPRVHVEVKPSHVSERIGAVSTPTSRNFCGNMIQQVNQVTGASRNEMTMSTPSVTDPSTQVLMQDADDEFRCGLVTTPKYGEHRRSSLKTVGEGFRGIQPVLPLDVRLPEEKSIDLHGISMSPSGNTQDLFSRGVSFGSSPMKLSTSKTHASFAPGILEHEGGKRMKTPESLPRHGSIAVSLDGQQHILIPSSLRYPINRSQQVGAKSPSLTKSLHGSQQNTQSSRYAFDLDAAIDQGQCFLET